MYPANKCGMKKTLILIAVCCFSALSFAEKKKYEGPEGRIPVKNMGNMTLEQVFQEMRREEEASGMQVAKKSCTSALRDMPMSPALAEALEKQTYLFKDLADHHQRLISSYINFDNDKLAMMLAVVKKLNKEELTYLLEKIMPYLTEFRAGLVMHAFNYMDKNPELFYVMVRDLCEGLKSGRTDEEDWYFINSVPESKIVN